MIILPSMLSRASGFVYQRSDSAANHQNLTKSAPARNG